MSTREPIFLPRAGDTIFKVGLYNAAVRALVKRNEHHGFYEDTWAAEHYRQVCARSREEARLRVQLRYPPNEGFVITAVVAVADAAA